MPVTRFLILGLAIWLAVQLIRRIHRNRRRTAQPRPAPYLETVACRHCGVHLPRDQALQQDTQFFCSTTHRDRHRPA